MLKDNEKQNFILYENTVDIQNNINCTVIRKMKLITSKYYFEAGIMPSTCTEDKIKIPVSKVFQYCSIMFVIMLYSLLFKNSNLRAVKWPEQNNKQESFIFLINI